MTKHRLAWIDFAKAAALIIVILVHSTPRDELSGILTGFVIPVFFILYGIGHNNVKHRDNLKKYIYGRFRGLMIPYIILSIGMVLLYWSLYPGVDVNLTPLDFVFWTIYGNGPPARVTHLWFLRTMFFAIILFSLIDKYLHDHPKARYAIILLLPQAAISLKAVLGMDLIPYAVDAVLVALSFMMLGNELRRYIRMSPWTISPTYDAIAAPIALGLCVLLAWINGFVNMGASTYGSWIYLYLVTGFLGTYALCVFSYYATEYSSRLTAAAESFNKYGQEIYEVHPLIIQANVEFLGGLPILAPLAFYPGAPLFLLNFPLAIILSYLFGRFLVSRFRVLQFIFRGWTIKPARETSFSIPDPNGENGLNNSTVVDEKT